MRFLGSAISRFTKDWSRSEPFWAAALILALAFLTGGGQRPDISSLVVLRPIAILALAYGLCRLEARHFRGRGFIVAFAFTLPLLVLIQLIPLPFAVWTMLPGRSVVAEIDMAAGLGEIWRPISITPTATWNSFFALFVPLSVLVLAMRLERRQLSSLIYVMIGVALLSCILGILQISGDQNGPFYLYRVTSPGSANGLFANRNHHALFLSCFFPILGALATDKVQSKVDLRLRMIVSLVIAVFLVPVIIVTGSRAGLICLVAGLLGAATIYGRCAEHHRFSKRAIWLMLLGVLLIAVAVIAATLLAGRAIAIDRLLESDVIEDGRLTIWRTTMAIIADYFPVGSGVGSFSSIFRMYEPHALLMTVATAHAHNDWLEVVVVAGMAGALLLAVSLAAWGKAFMSWCQGRGYAENNLALKGAGLWVLLLFGIASVFDYPMRVPSLSCFVCIALLWAGDGRFDQPAHGPRRLPKATE